MQSAVIKKAKQKKQIQPSWEIAALFPKQGQWSVQEYLDLPTNRQVEYVDGKLEVLPLPTHIHQRIILFLVQKLLALENKRMGIVIFAAISVRLWEGRYREPDIAFMLTEHKHRIHAEYWETPDLVMEVVSDSNRNHDLITKRNEYAKAGIPEYWIVDPETRTIIVLSLDGEKYTENGVYRENEIASSVLLPGLNISVREVWEAAEL
ncbi:MAG: Uma2 family endonuclease [Anaerolineales bacterium]